jgi:hypothetical protein
VSETLFRESIASWLRQLFLLWSWLFRVLQTGIGSSSKFGLELFDPASGVNELQLACVERMADIANVDSQLFANAFGNETIAATASNLRFDVVGVDLIFHDFGNVRLCKTSKRVWNFGVGEKGLEPPTSTL